MSKKRNNISYIKPTEPKFLQEFKQQAGIKAGPTLDSKRQKLEFDSDSGSDVEDDAPQVVVLKSTHLTAEEAALEKKRIEKEENEKRADLSQRVVFKSKKSEKQSGSQETKPDKKDKKRKDRPEATKSKLSFQYDDEEEEQE